MPIECRQRFTAANCITQTIEIAFKIVPALEPQRTCNWLRHTRRAEPLEKSLPQHLTFELRQFNGDEISHNSSEIGLVVGVYSGTLGQPTAMSPELGTPKLSGVGSATEYRRFSTKARVREFSNAKGWGVLDPTDSSVGGSIWFHFSHIDIEGYKTLEEGRLCDVDVETAEQDGYDLRALRVRPIA
jgi:CspA family cold shock protein